MKKLNLYYKVAVVCALLLAVLVASQLFFVLMPVYGIVGQDISEADAILRKADRTARVLNALMLATVIVMIVAAITGARKNTAHPRTKKEK